MKYILWDIDGTLLRTGRAGLHALTQTMADLYELKFEFDFPAGGRTDVFIAQQLLKKLPNQESLDIDAEVARLLNYYETLLPSYLEKHKVDGVIMPNIIPILDYLHEHAEYKSVLLTGNLRSGAKHKTDCYGISQYFDFDLSGFGDHTIYRNEIAQECFNKLRQADPSVSPDKVVVIGDTLHDISCADHIGARCIAVATGGESLDNLAQANPWQVYSKLPHVDTFAELLNK